MTIRLATLADVPRLVAMGRAQIAATYGGAVADAPEALTALATQLVTTPTGVCFVADAAGTLVGMIGLVRYASPLSGVATAGEVMWWVEPAARGVGLALLRRGERWAVETGARVIQMIAPEDRVGRVYARRGYQAIETTYQAPVTPAMSAITVADDVWPDLPAYRAATLAQPFGDVETAPGVVFHGIAPAVDESLPTWILARYPQFAPTWNFVRHSPAGQVEPNYIHTDCDMGAWTAIAYLTAAPAAGDGTTFWRWRETGAIQSTVAPASDAQVAEWQAWRDPAQWEPWHTVAARPGRVVLFPAAYYHSRALVENYGHADGARLIQVVFGTGTFPPAGGVV